VKVLSGLFRRLFLDNLEQMFQQTKLAFAGEIEPLRDPAAFARYLAPLRNKKWVVYAKPPFGGPQQVLEYLGRYTHRVALSNQRILKADDSGVTFQWKDYRQRDKYKSRTMTISAEEFIRRFLIHVLPAGFQRIRHAGFLANRHRKHKLALCRKLLDKQVSELLPEPDRCRGLSKKLEELDKQTRRCPQCLTGIMVRIDILPPYRWPALPPDTS